MLTAFAKDVKWSRTSLVDGVLNIFIGVAEKAENRIPNRYEKEVSEENHIEIHFQRNWTSCSHTVLRKGVGCQCGSRIVLHSPFLQATEGPYFTPAKAVADFILKELALNKLRAEPCLSTSSNVETQH